MLWLVGLLLLMINDVESALTALSGSPVPLQSASGMGRLFELFVMTGIAEALQSQGWLVSVLRSDGLPLAPGDPFIQRAGKPTGVAPAADGKFGQCTILIENPDTHAQWELWNGIQFRGRSNALHEFDVSVVPHQLALDLRSLPQTSFPYGRPNVAIECKEVSTAGSPDEMRTLVARLYDVSLIQGHTVLTANEPVKQIYPVSPLGDGYIPAERNYRLLNFATKSALVRTSGFSSGAVSMTSYYCISPYGAIKPGTVAAASFFNEIAYWIDLNL